uniref:Uncharacterized protein n=1 Tax=uncultured Flavobacteriia bacterium TaxID=212695 RepID=H6RDX2_9BACT|nr:hypothetical protein VIS_S3ATA30019 [uncultured Flavobacteriia bacterium]
MATKKKKTTKKKKKGREVLLKFSHCVFFGRSLLWGYYL